jgi:CheY-like chemotaxis protein
MQDVGEISIRTENFYVDKPTGTLGQVARGEYVKLTVSDSGCGIPEDILPKIFDPFFTTKEAGHKHGSGLGLSIVHAVVEDHHGFIDCESRPGEGTTFYLYFPIARDTAESTDSIRIVGGNETVLVVDDDRVQRDVTRHLLEKLGYSVQEASSGSEALEKLATEKYDLLVLDMIMPSGIDGTETFKKARELNPSQKAVIVSGFAESGRVEAAIELGAGCFVRKPLTLKSLAIAVRQELDRKTASPVKA